MEFWDIYDRERMKTGQVWIRGESLPEDAYHMVVSGCVFNGRGEMLIQQRQSFKEGWPNMWDITAAGSAFAGETSQAALEREMFEEIGLQIALQGVRPNMTVDFDEGFDDIYLLQQEVDLQTLRLQYEEVQAVKWASMEEILDMVDQGTFIPYYKSLIRLFFEMKGRYGCHKA